MAKRKPPHERDPIAVALGTRGARVRWVGISKKERVKAARKAARARWSRAKRP